jgi:uncharacterized protein
MARPLEDPLDVGLLASQDRELVREFAVATFERLQGSVARPEGRARLSLRFHVAGDFPAADGRLDATVWLVCQRCLCEYEATLTSPVRVAFVADDEAATRVPEDYEAVTVAARRLHLDEYVEDELLLALPLVPMHAVASECGVKPAVVVEEITPKVDKGPVQRPFAGLHDLLKR